jgi:hypothetical protein
VNIEFITQEYYNVFEVMLMNLNKIFTIYFNEITNVKRLKEIDCLIKNREISYFQAESIYEREDLKKNDVTFISVNISYSSDDCIMNVDLKINDEVLNYGIDDLHDMKNQVIRFVEDKVIPNLEKYKTKGIHNNLEYEIETYLEELDYIVSYQFKGIMPNLITKIL